MFSSELMETNLGRFVEQKGKLSFEEFFPIFGDILTG